MIYKGTFYAKKKTLAHINHYLNNEPTGPDDCFNETMTMSVTIKFKNGRWTEVTIHGVKYDENNTTNRPYVTAILYDRNGQQIDGTGSPARNFEGVWPLTHNGDFYMAYVMPEENDEPKTIPDMTTQQKRWFNAIMQNAIAEYTGFARNMHLAAMGSQTQEESVQFEGSADEAREFASKLKNMMFEVD